MDRYLGTRVWLSESSPLRHALLAVSVGVIAGVGAIVFRDLIALFHNLLFLGRLSLQYDANLHTPASPWGPWVFLVPVLGAIPVAFLIKNFAPEAKGHGVPEVMDAIFYNRGVIRPVVALVKSVASALSIGSGGAVGREGPIVQIGAAFGSTLGQMIAMPEWQRVTLIACGAAGGIAATFNTPIGGLLFAIELMMPEISARTLIPVGIATGSATLVGRAAFGDHPSFDIPALALPATQATTLGVFAAYIAFGMIVGAVSVFYIRAIYTFEDFFDRMPGNYYTRHALGMLLVGALMTLLMTYLGHYYIQGVGYATVQDVLTGVLSNPYLLLLLFAAKLVAVTLTLGSGGSGGIFSPSLFLGATLGGGYALLVNHFVPGIHIDAPSTALIGMAGMVGSVTGAVITSIVMIFEMTRDYNVIVPLMITVSIAYGVRQLLHTDSIYTVKLSRRGHRIPQSLDTYHYMVRTAGEAVSRSTVRVAPGTAIGELRRYRRRRWGPLPHVLLVESGQLKGVIPHVQVARLAVFGGNKAKLDTQHSCHYIVVDANELVLNLIPRLREAENEVALITRNGELKSLDDVVGVLTWEEILRDTNLPRQLVGRRSAGR